MENEKLLGALEGSLTRRAKSDGETLWELLARKCIDELKADNNKLKEENNKLKEDNNKLKEEIDKGHGFARSWWSPAYESFEEAIIGEYGDESYQAKKYGFGVFSAEGSDNDNQLSGRETPTSDEEL